MVLFGSMVGRLGTTLVVEVVELSDANVVLLSNSNGVLLGFSDAEGFGKLFTSTLVTVTVVYQ